MIEQKIYDNDGKSFYKIFTAEDVEFINPINYYGFHEIRKIASLEKELLNIKAPDLVKELDDKYFLKRAVNQWNEKYNEIISTEIPENFIKLLNSHSKKEQIALLKRQSITPDQLIAFIFKSWTDFNFTYSQYRAEHNHEGLDESKLPIVINIENEKVERIGKTELTDGQLKQVVNRRKVTISKFLDKDDTWHCFYITFKSIKGEESWKSGQAHYHYISNKFGIDRKLVVERLKSKDLPSSKVHIDLLEYGNQTIENKKQL